jgi:hypothetical protein
MSSSPSRHLSKVEQYKMKKQLDEQSTADVSGFFGRWGREEKSGLGRVGAVSQHQHDGSLQSASPAGVAAPSAQRSNQAVSFQQSPQQPPALQQFPPISGGGAFNLNKSSSSVARDKNSSPPAASRTFNTLEAKELQQQLDVIRAIREADAEASFMYGGSINHQSSPQPAPAAPAQLAPLQQQHLSVAGGDKVVCFCCQQLVPKGVVAYVPRESVLLTTKAASPSVAGAATKPKPRAKTSGVPRGGHRLEEVTRWKI